MEKLHLGRKPVCIAVRPETVIEEVESNGVFRSKKLYIFMIKFVVPLCMVIILISSILGIV